MEILNIGPLELIIVLILMFILLGPKEMVIVAYRIGQWVRNFVRSPMWREIVGYSMEIRELPKKLMDETGLEETLKEVRQSTQETVKEVNDSLREAAEAARVPEAEHLRIGDVPPDDANRTILPPPVEESAVVEDGEAQAAGAVAGQPAELTAETPETSEIQELVSAEDAAGESEAVMLANSSPDDGIDAASLFLPRDAQAADTAPAVVGAAQPDPIETQDAPAVLPVAVPVSEDDPQASEAVVKKPRRRKQVAEGEQPESGESAPAPRKPRARKTAKPEPEAVGSEESPTESAAPAVEVKRARRTSRKAVEQQEDTHVESSEENLAEPAAPAAEVKRPRRTTRKAAAQQEELTAEASPEAQPPVDNVPPPDAEQPPHEPARTGNGKVHSDDLEEPRQNDAG
jgi:Sec-independent protein translocase protein TatA